MIKQFGLPINNISCKNNTKLPEPIDSMIVGSCVVMCWRYINSALYKKNTIYYVKSIEYHYENNTILYFLSESNSTKI